MQKHRRGVATAKTTEVVLRFSDGPVAREDASAFAAAVQEPLTGIVEPESLCGTDVFGDFLPAGRPEFADLDARLTDIYEKSMIGPLERCGGTACFSTATWSTVIP